MRAAAAISRIAPLDLRVRAGVHVGECEVVNGKVGGLTVTIGARIAALAEAGQVLVSSGVRDLTAGSGLRFDAGETRTLKGVGEPWRVFRLVGTDEAPARRRLTPLYTRRQRRRAVLSGLAVVALVAIAVPTALLRSGHEKDVVVGEDNAGVIGPGDQARITAAVRVGQRPSAVAGGGGAVWVTNSSAGAVSRIDPVTNTSVQIPVGAGPSGVAVGAGAVWVANSGDATVSKITPTVRGQ